MIKPKTQGIVEMAKAVKHYSDWVEVERRLKTLVDASSYTKRRVRRLLDSSPFRPGSQH